MRFYKIIYFVFALFLFISVPADLSAQTARIIRGVVTDKTDGLPLPGASVIIKNENDRMIKGITTDVDGRYSIDVSIPNAILQITFVGMKPFEVAITNQTVLNVEMETAAESLQEVTISAQAKPKVNVGYMQIDTRDNATAIASIDVKDIAQSSATFALEMMQGRAAGVQIVAESGDPGAGFTVKIRGSASINSSSKPLFVIDGTHYTGEVGSFSDISELLTTRSPLQDVHPDDIESIDVLKDAGSTAIYGSRGANGVVIIKTKRGRANYTTISLNSSVSASFAPKDIPLLSGDDLKVFILEGMQNRSNFASSASSPVYPMLRDDASRADYYEYNNNTNWVKEIQKTGWTIINNLSLSGGGHSTTYLFSLGFTNAPGTLIGKSYDRFTTNFNLDYTISKNLKLTSSIAYSRSTQKDGGDGVSNFQGLLGPARQYPSFYPVFWPDGNGGFLDKYYVPFNTNITLYDKGMYNPVAWANLLTNDKNYNSFRSNVGIQINILKGLTLNSRVNFNFSNDSYNVFVPHAATNRNWNDWRVNYTGSGLNTSQYIGQENILTYALDINKIHSIVLSGVGKFDWWDDTRFSQTATNTGSTQVTGMSAATRWRDLTSSRSHDAYNQFIFMAHYKLLDRYIIQPSVTREGSSRFGEANRFGYFPQVSLSWRISGEPFLQSATFMDDVKIRYSWGLSGQSPSDKYLYFSLYDAGSTRYIDKIGTTSGGIQLNTLKWEVTTTQNIGLDAVLFGNKLNLIIDAYDKLTDDLLLQRQLPSSSGFGNYWTNYGTVRTQGLEFFANATLYDVGRIKVMLSGNISFVKSKLEKLPDDSGLATDWYSGYPFMVKEGDPIGSFYGLRYKGVYATEEDAVARDRNGDALYDMNGKPKPVRWDNLNGYVFQAGDAIYEDLDHDGLITDADRTIIGNANPAFYGGFGPKLIIGNWSFDFFFQYQYGNDIINMVRKDLETMNGGNDRNVNQSRAVMKRWRKQGDITEIPRVTFDSHRNAEGSNRFVEDGSYLRLKNISITYSVPSSFTSKIGIKRASATLSSTNTFTWTKYLGVDPEIRLSGTQSNPFRMGLDQNRTPVPRSVTVGLKIAF